MNRRANTARSVLVGGVALVALAGVACGGPEPVAPVRSAALPPKPVGGVAAPDPLGPRPEVAPPNPYTPPVPVVFAHKGLTVWLIERHTLPLVSVVLVTPGAKHDGPDKAGLAMMTGEMLERGAGKRDALQIASDFDRLGASFGTGASPDALTVEVTVLKKNLGAAMDIFGDVILRPTFPEAEWKRAHELWENDLKQRAKNPPAVASTVMAHHVYSEGSPYRTPASGTLRSVKNVTLADARAFYKKWLRPDLAKCVVVGDVTRAEVEALLDRSLKGWTAGPGIGFGFGAKAPAKGRRVFVVDRPEAPQSVIAVGRPAPAAGDADVPLMIRANEALGGSFTSRLNQDLREEHGWSYGASSRVSANALGGSFVAQAAVETDHTGEALGAMLGDMERFAARGLTADEVDKTRLLARTSLVQAYETVEQAAHRLARVAAHRLDPDYDAKSSASLYGASAAQLNAVIAKDMSIEDAVIVIVGPKARLEPQLRAIGITDFRVVGPEGE